MKKELSKVPEPRLREIARDYNITQGTRQEVINELTEYLRAYGLRWADLVARYPDLGKYT